MFGTSQYLYNANSVPFGSLLSTAIESISQTLCSFKKKLSVLFQGCGQDGQLCCSIKLCGCWYLEGHPSKQVGGGWRAIRNNSRMIDDTYGMTWQQQQQETLEWQRFQIYHFSVKINVHNSLLDIAFENSKWDSRKYKIIGTAVIQQAFCVDKWDKTHGQRKLK